MDTCKFTCVCSENHICLSYSATYDCFKSNTTIICSPGDDNHTLRNLLLNKILNHPNILPVENVSVSPQNVPVVSTSGEEVFAYDSFHIQYANLIPLDEYIYSHTLSFNTKQKIFLDIAHVITYLCYKGIYHQNIHPSNIYIDPITKIAYLSNFGDANSNHILTAYWIDPAISELNFTNQGELINNEILISGNVWSLGLLGVWLFIDDNIYDWASGIDDEEMDIVYFLKGRFNKGLEKAHLNLNDIPMDMINLLDDFMHPLIEIRFQALGDYIDVSDDMMKEWGEDAIDITQFNEWDLDKRIKHVCDVYDIVILYHVVHRVSVVSTLNIIDNKPEIAERSKNVLIDDYVNNMKSLIIECKNESIIVVKDVLTAIEVTPSKSDKLKLFYLLYDHVLPKCYNHIDSRIFWKKVIDKLHETSDLHDIADLKSRRLTELKLTKSKY